ncbi:dynamin GTPase [[Emmonsia] crescens]|uniref:Dynamin GTPase n=1 Tax=[Emmonsia] crescens TaxID=73230 RepID=A0A0G2J1G5_9EURO|nr:dynamin GTPase [Emmonsia crescens UAMH 3008]
MQSPQLHGADAMSQLQSEQSELLDVIDQLRTLRLGRLVDLPQLIVCGDQSSGKSSVLEAISRVRFPVKGGVCTRFATEVILRRSPHQNIKVTIEPGPSRVSEAERTRLSNFQGDFSAAADLPTLIEKAKECMGISSSTGINAAFSDDILKVEISGPDKPELSLVDLPGLYRAKSREQDAGGIQIVRTLVEKYMSNSKSIILAVVSAKSEYNLQEVLDLAERHDGKRERTLGIITKPDTLAPGSEDEEMYISYASNEHIKLNLGWHVLRNRDYETKDVLDDARDELEREFFETGSWATVSREFVGIDSLRYRLSKLLLGHIRKTLPGLIAEIQDSVSKYEAKVESLGNERSTLRQQKEYLLNISGRFEKITGQAVHGMYFDSFFGGLYSNSPTSDFRRLRAVIRALNQEFAGDMLMKGRRRVIIDDVDDSGVEAPGNAEGASTDEDSTKLGSLPKRITRADLEKEINELASKNRGIELPGNPNQYLVGDLFRDQSRPWEGIAYNHITNVWEAVNHFVEQLLKHITDEFTHSRVLRTVLDPKLENIKENLQDKLKEMLSYHKRGHPLPLDVGFLVRVESLRKQRQLAHLENGLRHIFPDAVKEPFIKGLSLNDIQIALSCTKLPTDKFAASEIIDHSEAYYDMAIHTFIDNVSILVIENCLIHPLETILTPLSVHTMEDTEVERLAAEPPRVHADRQKYQLDLATLNAGLRACNRYNTRNPRGLGGSSGE